MSDENDKKTIYKLYKKARKFIKENESFLDSDKLKESLEKVNFMKDNDECDEVKITEYTDNDGLTTPNEQRKKGSAAPLVVSFILAALSLALLYTVIGAMEIDYMSYVKLMFSIDKDFIYVFFKVLNSKGFSYLFFVFIGLDFVFIYSYTTVFSTFFSIMKRNESMPESMRNICGGFGVLAIFTAIIDSIETIMFAMFYSIFTDGAMYAQVTTNGYTETVEVTSEMLTIHMYLHYAVCALFAILFVWFLLCSLTFIMKKMMGESKNI